MEPQLQQSGLLVLAIVMAVLAERGWQWLRRRRAQNWPTAQGRIHSADWRQPRTGTNRYFLADVSYYYFVDGHFYSGYLRRSFSNSEAASAWVKNLLGVSIQVRYNPEAPGASFLLEEDFATHADSVAEPVLSR